MDIFSHFPIVLRTVRLSQYQPVMLLSASVKSLLVKTLCYYCCVGICTDFFNVDNAYVLALSVMIIFQAILDITKNICDSHSFTFCCPPDFSTYCYVFGYS